MNSNWIKSLIKPNGESKQQQMKSLRKKIIEHRDSKTHQQVECLLNEKNNNALASTVGKMNKEQQDITHKVFRSAYYLAKSNRPFTDPENLIDLQRLNGLDMGRILHSNVAATNIVNYISSEMKNKLFLRIKQDDTKCGLILDESTSLSNASCLIIYIRAAFKETEYPVNLFMTLTELSNTTSQGIFMSLMSELNKFHLDENFLQNNLVSVTTDGACVMLGRHFGVCKLLLEKFPNIIAWHCLNHRLELSVGDVIEDITGINHFKIFIDKIRNIYHSSLKNQRELIACSETLGQEILKIGKVLDTRWSASSFRTVKAVWQNYAVLHKHFIESSQSITRDAKEKATFLGLASTLSSVTFLGNLALMYDALQELSDHSLQLQERNTNLIDAYHQICILIQVFERRVDTPGKFFKEAQQAIPQGDFRGIGLKEASKNIPVIPTGQFYRSIAESMKTKLLSVSSSSISPSYTELVTDIKVLYPKHWPDTLDITYEENEIDHLAEKFNLNSRDVMKGFRTFKFSGGKEVTESMKKMFSVISSVAVSSAECERGFSAMNLIMTDLRSSLLIPTLSNLLFINLVGPSLKQFNPAEYVKSWLAAGHHSACDTNLKSRNLNLTLSQSETDKLWRNFT